MMSGPSLMLGGVSIAAGLALALALPFVSEGGVGSGVGFAFAAALGCVATLLLQRMRRHRAAPAQAREASDATEELGAAFPGKAISSADPADSSVAPNVWKLAVALSVNVVAATIGLLSVPLLMAEDPVTIASAPVTPAQTSDEDAEPSPTDASSLAAKAAVIVPSIPASAPISTRLVTRTVTPSLARRECLAQVESAHLFLGIARQARSASAYTRLTNPEIKRLKALHPIGPYTLQHIAQRMWDLRAEPERDPSWWSQQYSRCEETRIDGGAYVVRG